MQRKHFWLCLPPVVACLLDNVFTLWRQSAAYWAGEYWAALEPAPHGRWLLTRHPLAFEAGTLAIILFVCFVILYMPRVVAMAVSTAIVLGHLTGASFWIADERPWDGYWINLGLCGLAAVFLAISYHMTQPPSRLPETDGSTPPDIPSRESTTYHEPFSTN